MAQVAREKGCARSTVSSAITRFGLIRDNRSPNPCHKGQLAYVEKMVNGRIVQHKAEQVVVQAIVRMRKSGSSYKEIADWLNNEGYPTKNRTKRWSRPTIYKIVKREEFFVQN